jgi:hypothetical protein
VLRLFYEFVSTWPSLRGIGSKARHFTLRGLLARRLSCILTALTLVKAQYAHMSLEGIRDVRVKLKIISKPNVRSNELGIH